MDPENTAPSIYALPQIEKYPRTPHIEGSNLQAGDGKERVRYSHLLRKYIVVEEKLDGANSGVTFSNAAELLLQSRWHYLTGGGREVQFALLKSWVKSIDSELFDTLTNR